MDEMVTLLAVWIVPLVILFGVSPFGWRPATPAVPSRTPTPRRMARSVFDAAGGMPGLRRLAEAWHERVMADEVVSHAFSHGFHPQHSERLAAYWAEALGGPPMYSGSY